MQKQIAKFTMNNRTVKVYHTDNFVPEYLVYIMQDGKPFLLDGFDSMDDSINYALYYCKFGTDIY